MYEYAFRPFILIVHSCLGPVLSLYVFVCILRVLSFILVQTRRVCLCPCKQANVFISSYMCSMFLSVLHKDELTLWFVLHAVRLYRHANTSQQPAVWIIHYVRKHCFPVENIYFRFSFSEMNSRWYSTITKEKKKKFCPIEVFTRIGSNVVHSTEEHLWIQWVGSISPSVGHHKVRLLQAGHCGSFCSQWKNYRSRDSLRRHLILQQMPKAAGRTAV